MTKKKSKKKSLESTPTSPADIAKGGEKDFRVGGAVGKVVKTTKKKSTAGKKPDAKDAKQEKMFHPGEDYAAYEKRIKSLLKLRRGLISEVRKVKKDLEWLFLDAVSHFEYKTDLRVKKIEFKRNTDGDMYNVELEIGF
jgi:hypothetical protein